VPQPATPAPSAAEAFPAESPATASERGAAEPKAETKSNVARDSAFGGAGVAAPAAAPAAPAAAGKLAPMRRDAIQRSPEAWLEEISRLKRAGREKEAAEFRRLASSARRIRLRCRNQGLGEATNRELTPFHDRLRL
jgi:hypothetical protein